MVRICSPATSSTATRACSPTRTPFTPPSPGTRSNHETRRHPRARRFRLCALVREREAALLLRDRLSGERGSAGAAGGREAPSARGSAGGHVRRAQPGRAADGAVPPRARIELEVLELSARGLLEGGLSSA